MQQTFKKSLIGLSFFQLDTHNYSYLGIVDDFVCDVDGAVREVGPSLVGHGNLYAWTGKVRCVWDREWKSESE